MQYPVPVAILCTYEDGSLLEQLKKQLAALVNQRYITLKDNLSVPAGAIISDYEQQMLQEAAIVLIVTSSSFLASDWVSGPELSFLFSKVTSGQVKIIPVLADYCDLPESFKALSILPHPNHPITDKRRWDTPDQAMLVVVSAIREAIQLDTAPASVPPIPEKKRPITQKILELLVLPVAAGLIILSVEYKFCNSSKPLPQAPDTTSTSLPTTSPPKNATGSPDKGPDVSLPPRAKYVVPSASAQVGVFCQTEGRYSASLSNTLAGALNGYRATGAVLRPEFSGKVFQEVFSGNTAVLQEENIAQQVRFLCLVNQESLEVKETLPRDPMLRESGIKQTELEAHYRFVVFDTRTWQKVAGDNAAVVKSTDRISSTPQTTAAKLFSAKYLSEITFQ